MISSSPVGNLLLDICFGFGSCRSNDNYLKLTPTNFNPNSYSYTIHIPKNYPFYTSTGPMRAEFYIKMNVSNPNVAKSVLYNAMGNQVLTSSDLAYHSNEMMLMSVGLWQPENRVPMFDTDNEVTTKLIVYQFNGNNRTESNPYILKFQRNEK
jgi:hypothetical protein